MPRSHNAADLAFGLINGIDAQQREMRRKSIFVRNF